MSRRRRRACVNAARVKVAGAKALRRRAREVAGKPVATAVVAALTMTGLGASTAAGSALRTLPSNPSNLVSVGGTTFFTADDGVHGTELWRSDGTRAGTVLVKDIRPGGYSSNPSSLAVVGDRVFFTARDGRHGQELWRSDGTRAGTVLVKDITAGIYGSSPSNLTGVGATLFFTADDRTRGRELWKSDGTTTGTVLVKDIEAGRYSSE